MKALIVRQPWIQLILNGSKDWEMRKRAVAYRGPLALIQGGSGLVVGISNLVDVLEQLSLDEFLATQCRHGIPVDYQTTAFEKGWRTPWVLQGSQALNQPVPYRHPQGAVTWVNLTPEETAAVLAG